MFDCVNTPTGRYCGGFVGNPLLWGPFGWPLAPIGNFTPSLIGFLFAVAWWLFLGTLAGLMVDWSVRRRNPAPRPDKSQA